MSRARRLPHPSPFSNPVKATKNAQQKKPRHRSLGTAAYRLLVVQKKKRVTELRDDF
jgi:hypothetical protein